MTKGRTCRHVERLILEREERPLVAAEARLVEEHLGGCRQCRGFEASRRLTRNGLKDVPWPTLPDALDARTGELVRNALDGSPTAIVADLRPVPGKAKIPVPIAVALVLATALTVIWLTLSLVDIGPLESLKSLEDLPLAGRIALALIAQNAAVLLFAPVLLRQARASQNEYESQG